MADWRRSLPIWRRHKTRLVMGEAAGADGIAFWMGFRMGFRLCGVKGEKKILFDEWTRSNRKRSGQTEIHGDSLALRFFLLAASSRWILPAGPSLEPHHSWNHTPSLPCCWRCPKPTRQWSLLAPCFPIGAQNLFSRLSGGAAIQGCHGVASSPSFWPCR
ncbi:hypothetical protein VTI74DRAFT_2371 [Chaetomium olivicolor]